MNTKLYFCALLLLFPLLMVGCATAPHSVDGANGGIHSDNIDTEDFALIAKGMIDSMIDSPTFSKYNADKRAILVVGNIVNDTHIPMGRLDTDLLTKKIRIALNQSGKAITDTTGQNNPDFRLNGRVLDTYIPGNTRQHTYTVQLSLINPQGLAVWEDERAVRKQSTRGALGG